MNPDVQINSEGREVNYEVSGYMWLDSSCMQDAIAVSSDVMPTIKTPLTSQSLDLIIRLLQTCKHNDISALLTLSGMLMAFHYESVLSLWSGCPIVIAIGLPETGKSTAIKLGLSMVGMDESSKYVSGSTTFFLERSSLSTLPFGIDDPPEPNSKSPLKPADVIMSIYNGAKTAPLT